MAWTDPKTWATDEVVTAAMLNTHLRDNLLAVGPISKKYKTADESVTSSVTFQADDHLVFPIAANEIWAVHYTLFYQAAAAGDLATAVVAPTGVAAGSWLGQIGSALATTDRLDTNMSVLAVQGLGTGNPTQMGSSGTAFHVGLLFAYVANGANAGNVELWWAQNASSGTATILKAGSWLLGTRLSP